MRDWFIYSIGFSAQILFSARLIHQWIKSEKLKRIATPALFWKLSLLASVLLFAYGYLREDKVIMFGQSLTWFIYFRNLSLQGYFSRFKLLLPFLFLLVPVAFIVHSGTDSFSGLMSQAGTSDRLFQFGIAGQVIFNCRFIYQWLYSEKHRKSTLPFGFWLLSLSGAALIVIYAIFRKDPVLLFGHLGGVIIYSRSVFLSRKTYAETA